MPSFSVISFTISSPSSRYCLQLFLCPYQTYTQKRQKVAPHTKSLEHNQKLKVQHNTVENTPPRPNHRPGILSKQAAFLFKPFQISKKTTDSQQCLCTICQETINPLRYLHILFSHLQLKVTFTNNILLIK